MAYLNFHMYGVVTLHLLKTLCLILLVGAMLPGIKAQSWQDSYNSAWAHYDQGQHSESIEIAKSILDDSPTENARLFLLKLMSANCAESGKFEEGVAYGREEYGLCQKLGVPDSVLYNTLNTLSTNLIGQGDYEGALDVTRNSAGVSKSAFGEGSYEFNYSLSQLGTAFFHLQKPDSALSYFNQANKGLMDIPEGGLDFLNNQFMIGLIFYQENQLVEAAKRFTELKDLLEMNALQKELIYAQTCENLGVILYSEENFLEAENTLRSSLVTYNQLGLEPKEVPELVNSLALAMLKNDRRLESDSLLGLLDESQLNINVVINQLNTANLRFAMGNYNGARSDLEEILSKTNSGPELLHAQAVLLKIKLDFERNLLEPADLDFCEQIFTAAGARARLAETLYYRSKHLQAKNEIDTALEAILSGADQVIASVGDPSTLKVLNESLRLVLANRGYDEARVLFTRILEETHWLDPELAYKLRHNFAIFLYTNNYGYEALATILPLTELTLGDATLQFHLAAIKMLEDQQRLSKAEEILGKVKSLDAAKIPVGARAELLALEARIYLGRGDYISSERLFNESLALIQAETSVESEIAAEIHNSAGIFYQTVGNYEAAENAYGTALQFAGPDSPLRLDIPQNLATLQQMQGRYESSIKTLDQVLVGYESYYGRQHPSYAVTLQNLAAAFEKTGKYEEAIGLIKEAISIDDVNGRQGTVSYLNKLHNLGVLYMDSDLLVEAEKTLRDVVEQREKLLGTDHPDYAQSLQILATVLQRQGNMDEALRYFDVMIEKYKFQVSEFFPYLSEKEKSSYYAKIQAAFKAYIDFTVEYSQKDPTATSKLLDFQLGYKAALLSSSLDLRTKVRQSGDPELVEMYDQWRVIKELVTKLMVQPAGDIAVSTDDIAQLREQANQMEKDLSQKSEGLIKTSELSSNWLDIRARLKEGEMAMEILRVQKNITNDSVWYVVLMVRPDTEDYPEMEVLANGVSLEGRLFSYYRNSIQFRIKDSRSFENYWAPIKKHLDGVHHLYLSPDGIFNKINVSTLYNAEAEEYVLDEVTVQHVTNLTEITRNHEESENFKVDLFGNPEYDLVGSNPDQSLRGPPIDPLPGTDTETKLIRNLFIDRGWDVELFSGPQASENQFKQVRGSGILHVASHGFFLSDQEAGSDFYSVENNPLMRSGLLLSGARNTFFRNTLRFNSYMQGEDGVLTAHEVLNMDFEKTDLVVLSACETGLGEVKNGEGVYGLQRAFIIAGVNSVLISLWKVDDEATRDLMTRFYGNLLNGMAKNDALTEAQREIRNTYKDPVYWGAFVLYGI